MKSTIRLNYLRRLRRRASTYLALCQSHPFSQAEIRLRPDSPPREAEKAPPPHPTHDFLIVC